MDCNLMLAHSADNPRNSEGAFVELADGSLLFAYTRYNGSHWGDNSSADICAITSTDGGTSWSTPEIIIKNRGRNVMSVSLLRLQDNRIALVYLEKTSVGDTPFIDCRPWICFSDDEAKTWSSSIDIAGIPPAYLVVNNDRLVQLKSGRLILPACYHCYNTGSGMRPGFGIFFLSDDGGLSWRQSKQSCYPEFYVKGGLLEPGVIELSDGRIMCWFRTQMGCQYKSFSSDGGEHWSQAIPAPEFRSPSSPLSMKRDPQSGNLVAVWNHHHPQLSVNYIDGVGGRTPLVLAQSCDEGLLWQDHLVLENAPDHGYAYTAMTFYRKKLYLAYCCGGKPDCSSMLQDCCIKSLELKTETL